MNKSGVNWARAVSNSVILVWCFALASVLQARCALANEGYENEAKRQLRNVSPPAADLLQNAESLLESRQHADALAVLSQAAQIQPDNAVIARRQCLALTELGQSSEAVNACRRSLSHELSQKEWPEDMLAMVRALMSARRGPSSDQLFQAISIASSLMRKVPNQPWPYLAQCVIASRLASPQAPHHCDPSLRGWAAVNAHYDPLAGIGGVRRFQWQLMGVWLLLGLGILGTILHAARARIRNFQLARIQKATAAVSVVILLFAPTHALADSAHASKPTDIGSVEINEKDPSSSVPSPERRDRDPLGYAYFVMDVTARGERALKQDDSKTAILYFKALVKAVPNKAVGYTKLCTAYEAALDWPSALESCRSALGFEGVKDGDYAKYAHLLMEHRSKLTRAEVEDIDAIVQQLRTATPPSPVADIVECEIGTKLHDKVRLQRCTENLAASNPTAPSTLSFQWAFAVERGDYAGARALVERLRQSDEVRPEALKRMDDATALALPAWRRATTKAGFIVAVVGAAVIVALLMMLGKRQLHHAKVAK